MSKSVAITNHRFFVPGGRGLRFAACFLAALMAYAALPAFADDGDKDYEKGVFALEEGNVETAVKYFTKAMEKGNAEAANRLGMIKHHEKKFDEAFKLSYEVLVGFLFDVYDLHTLFIFRFT